MTIFAVACLENVKVVNLILLYLNGNVLIPENEKKFCAWYIITHCFFFVVLYLHQKYGLGLGFRFGLSADPVLHILASLRLSLKTQSKIEFLGLFSSHRKLLV